MVSVRNPFELAGPRGEDDFFVARTPRCEDIPAAGDEGKSEKARKCARQDREPGRAPAAAAQKIASSMGMGRNGGCRFGGFTDYREIAFT